MTSTHSTPLFSHALAEVHRRWGEQALRPLSQLSRPTARLPTGFPALDDVLDGGIPRGRMIELLGRGTSGMVSLGLKMVAGAQAQSQEVAAYVDLKNTFDPAYAAQVCNVDLDRLLVVQPPDVAGSLEILYGLAIRSGTGLIVFDSVADVLTARQGAELFGKTLRRLSPMLARTNRTVIFLHPPDADESALAHYAALRLSLTHSAWITQDEDVLGYQVAITVVKSTVGGLGQTANVSFWLDAAVQESAS